MRGPFHMKLATGKESGPHIRVDQWLNLNDKLIKRVHYQAFIVKSSQPLTPDCQYTKPEEPKCPASEYIKTKVSMTPHEGVTVEAQQETTTKVGTDAINIDTTGKISAEGSKGMFTGSAEFNPTDGSYAVSVGVGIGSPRIPITALTVSPTGRRPRASRITVGVPCPGMYAPDVLRTCVRSQRGRNSSTSLLPNSRFMKAFETIAPSQPAAPRPSGPGCSQRSTSLSMKGQTNEYAR